MGLPDLGIITVDEVALLHPPGARALADCRFWSMATPATAKRSTSCTWCAPSRMPAPLPFISRTSCFRRNAGISTTRSWPMPHDMAAKVAAAAKARRHLYHRRTNRRRGQRRHGRRCGAGQALSGSGRRRDIPRGDDFARHVPGIRRRVPGVPLLANMTEFGRTPFFTAAEFEAMGYRMVIWPVSSLRVANKAQAQSVRRHQTRWRHPQNGRSNADPRRTLRDDRAA